MFSVFSSLSLQFDLRWVCVLPPHCDKYLQHLKSFPGEGTLSLATIMQSPLLITRALRIVSGTTVFLVNSQTSLEIFFLDLTVYVLITFKFALFFQTSPLSSRLRPTIWHLRMHMLGVSSSTWLEENQWFLAPPPSPGSFRKGSYSGLGHDQSKWHCTIPALFSPNTRVSNFISSSSHSKPTQPIKATCQRSFWRAHSFIIFKNFSPVTLLPLEESEEIPQRAVGTQYVLEDVVGRGQRTIGFLLESFHPLWSLRHFSFPFPGHCLPSLSQQLL